MISRRDLISALAGLALPGLAMAVGDAAKPGDVVFRLGALDRVTRAIVAHSPMPEESRRWSHVGVVVSGGSDPLVAHAMPHAGVHLDRLEAFRAAPAARDSVLLQIHDAELGQRFARATARRLGMPFDHRLRWSDDSAVYCTELVVKALADAGVQVQAPTVWALGYRERMVHPDSLLISLIQTQIWMASDTRNRTVPALFSADGRRMELDWTNANTVRTSIDRATIRQ